MIEIVIAGDRKQNGEAIASPSLFTAIRFHHVEAAPKNNASSSARRLKGRHSSPRFAIETALAAPCASSEAMCAAIKRLAASFDFSVAISFKASIQ